MGPECEYISQAILSRLVKPFKNKKQECFLWPYMVPASACRVIVYNAIYYIHIDSTNDSIEMDAFIYQDLNDPISILHHSI